jgi:hypothetical protein
MVLIGPLLWWVGVVATAAAAYSAVAPNDTAERYLISNYDEPGRLFACFFVLVNLALIAVLMPTAGHLRTMRSGTLVRAIVMSVLAFGVAWIEYQLNPVTANWGGDPDAWSAVERHVAPWYGGAAVTWLALTALTASTVAVQALAALVSAAGRRRTSSGRA